MRFWKYQGLGNDFILIDGTDGDTVIDPGWCEMMCDRHFGIGADGVLYVLPGEGTDITMRIINADGSEAEMCGNGIRCVAKYAYDKGLVDRTVFTIHTLAGDLEATVTLEDGEVGTVRINMARPSWTADRSPWTSTAGSSTSRSRPRASGSGPTRFPWETPTS